MMYVFALAIDMLMFSILITMYPSQILISIKPKICSSYTLLLTKTIYNN